jgi:hypothetical protein
MIAGGSPSQDICPKCQQEVNAESIRRAVDAWPPLTTEQREKLGLLLAPREGDSCDVNSKNIPKGRRSR